MRAAKTIELSPFARTSVGTRLPGQRNPQDNGMQEHRCCTGRRAKPQSKTHVLARYMQYNTFVLKCDMLLCEIMTYLSSNPSPLKAIYAQPARHSHGVECTMAATQYGVVCA